MVGERPEDADVGIQRVRIERVHHRPQRGNAKPFDDREGRGGPFGLWVLAEQPGRQIRIATPARVDERLQHGVWGASHRHAAEFVREAGRPCIGRLGSGGYVGLLVRAALGSRMAVVVITERSFRSRVLSTQAESCARRKAAKPVKSQPALPFVDDQATSCSTLPGAERGRWSGSDLGAVMARAGGSEFIGAERGSDFAVPACANSSHRHQGRCRKPASHPRSRLAAMR